MQEHIRRAHPEHYISKLPATEESFHLMITTPPSERPQQPQQNPAPANAPNHQAKAYAPDRNTYYRDESSNPGTPRQYEDYPGGLLPAATNAAAALASLHNYKTGTGSDWDAEGVSLAKFHYEIDPMNHFSDLQMQEWVSDSEKDRMPRSSVELPPLQPNNTAITSEPFSGLSSSRPRDLLSSIMATSPPGRSSTLPPLQRPMGPSRPRKQSVTKRGRETQHRKQRSRDAKDWVKRGKIDIAGDLLQPTAQERPRPYSAEPQARSPWMDLLEAATSVADDLNEERTPVSLPEIKFTGQARADLATDAPVSRVYPASFFAALLPAAVWAVRIPSVPLAAGLDAAKLRARDPWALPIRGEWRERGKLPHG
jgi:hypothetical protein